MKAKEIAELLYMGLVSDSNRFLFNNCSSSTFKNVSEILKAKTILQSTGQLFPFCFLASRQRDSGFRSDRSAGRHPLECKIDYRILALSVSP